MTEHDWVMLGARAVACEHFRWMPGMRAIEGVLREGHSGVWQRAIDGLKGLEWFHAHGGCWEPVPDFRDDATKGCLLALVREAREGQFTVCGEAQVTPQALVDALEAANA